MFSNQTPNYGLPQWKNNDTPTWLSDMNGAFANIDANLKRVEDKADEGGVPQEIIDRIVALETSVTNIVAKIGTDVIDTIGTSITNAIVNLKNRIDNIMTLIGDDVISSVGTSITNAIVNLKSAIYETYTKSETDNLLNELINKIFPTGTLRITYTKISPATYIGGQWELIEEGYYLVATTQDTIDEETERFLNAELPNIKGELNMMPSRGLVDKSGAFEESTSTGTVNWGGGSGNDNRAQVKFNASKGQVNEDDTTYVEQEDSVYKDGGKVQPKSLKIYIWRRIDDTNLNR